MNNDDGKPGLQKLDDSEDRNRERELKWTAEQLSEIKKLNMPPMAFNRIRRREPTAQES